MRFDFDLLPLEDIVPWGEPGEETLHWFGLTDGRYWIDVGTSRLFEYSQAARQRGAAQFCSYQVARLHEDLLEAFPHIIEPVPADLVPHLSGTGRWRTGDCLAAWCEGQPPRDDDAFWATVAHATTWIGQRAISTAHLSPSVDFVMWSDDAAVHVEWDNREKTFQGVPAWSAERGSFSLSRAGFVEAVQGFHERLMDAMAERVRRVAAGGLRPGIRVDLPALQWEQAEHAASFPGGCAASATPTDWDAVRQALRTIHA